MSDSQSHDRSQAQPEFGVDADVDVDGDVDLDDSDGKSPALDSETIATLATEERVGEAATHSAVVTDESVRKFARISGDQNPIHTDEEAAGESLFGGRVAHGMFCASFTSAALWQLGYPDADEDRGGDSTSPSTPTTTNILRKQSLEYEAPVRLGDELVAVAIPIDVEWESDSDTDSNSSSGSGATRQIRCETPVINQDGEVVISGEATLRQIKDGQP